MPQGDLVFFPYDATVVLGGYLVGYALFVGVFAPRMVLTVRARARLVAPVSASPTAVGGARPAAWSPPKLAELTAAAAAAGVGAYPVHTSETLLAFVQFGLLTLFLYYLGSGRLAQAHPRVELQPHPRRTAPTFGATTAVADNLVRLWGTHRDGLYLRPAAAALAGATHHALALLHRGVPPGVLPRLLGVVRASRGVAR